MKYIISMIVALGLLSLASLSMADVPSPQAPIYFAIVVNAKVPLKKVSLEQQIKPLYLGQSQLLGLNRQTLIPLDLASDHQRSLFYTVLGMDNDWLNQYWQNQIFSGGSQPPQRLSLNQVIKRLISSSKYIAYLPVKALFSNQHPHKQIKVLKVFEVEK